MIADNSSPAMFLAIYQEEGEEDRHIGVSISNSDVFKQINETYELMDSSSGGVKDCGSHWYNKACNYNEFRAGLGKTPESLGQHFIINPRHFSFLSRLNFA